MCRKARKRRFSWIQFLVFIAVLLTTACDAATSPGALPEDAPRASETQPVDFTQPTFYLKTLPELTPYEASREIVRRYAGEAFVDDLKPAADYGKLYPYEGRFSGPRWGQNTYYGLVDAHGRVVVDPVYRQAYYVTQPQGEEPAYLVLAYPVDTYDKTAQKLLSDTWGDIQRSRYIFASADGSWVSSVFYGDGAGLSGDRIIIYDYDMDSEHYWREQSFRLYDLAGRLIAKGNGQVFGFYEGLSVVFHGGYNAQTDTFQDYYDYIDKNGQVVIAGPFLQADNFQNGRAHVMIGEDWDHKQYGLIDTQGNFIAGPTEEEIRYDAANDYTIFQDQMERWGVKDLSGKVIVNAAYGWIHTPYEPGTTLAIGQRGDSSWWIIDLKSGEEKKLALAGKTITGARIIDDNWCEINYESFTGKGLALLKGDAEHCFDYGGQDNMYCNYIQDGLFACNYYNYEQDRAAYRAEIFDADSGLVLKTLESYHYSHQFLGKILIFFSPDGSRQLVLNRDFEPVFRADVFGNEHLQNIRHVADDVYSVRTAFCSGLLKENGQWLVRVYMNSLD